MIFQCEASELQKAIAKIKRKVDQLYYLCEAHRAELTGKLQIEATNYRIDLYQVEE